jgi:hypothetical protein
MLCGMLAKLLKKTKENKYRLACSQTWLMMKFVSMFVFVFGLTWKLSCIIEISVLQNLEIVLYI